MNNRKGCNFSFGPLVLGKKWRKKEKWGKWKGESEKEEMGKVKKGKWGKWKRRKGKGKRKTGGRETGKGVKKREIIFYSLVLAHTENWMKPFEEKYIFPWKGKGKRKRGKEKGKGEKKREFIYDLLFREKYPSMTISCFPPLEG